MGIVGFEPTQPKAPDLQSGPALQLRRIPRFGHKKTRILIQAAINLRFGITMNTVWPPGGMNNRWDMCFCKTLS